MTEQAIKRDPLPLRERIEALGGSCRKKRREHEVQYLTFDADGKQVSRTISGAWAWVRENEAPRGED